MEQTETYIVIAELISKQLKGNLSPEESHFLQKWLAESKSHQKIWDQLTDPVYLEKKLPYWASDNTQDYWKKMQAMIKGQSRRQMVLRKTRKYAATLLLLFSTGAFGWYLWSLKKTNQTNDNASHVNILPKGKVAQLVLGNGKVVALKGNDHQAITEKDGTKVRNSDNVLHYSVAGNQETEKTPLLYNTLLTPRGGEYQVTLSDGTKVWLNAASSLRYPVQFEGDQRKVFLSGEGYFEVAKDQDHPFIVQTDKMKIKVLGTRFNISSYADEPKQRVSLAEGALRVSTTEKKKKQSVRLQPAYEAVLRGNATLKVEKSDLKAALAWKDGMFVFDNSSLGSIMRTLARWYDVEVIYTAGVDSSFHFTGRIQRYERINKILELIRIMRKVDFNIKGSKIYVTPYS